MEDFIIKPEKFKPLKLAFKETNLKSFDTKVGIILWCCVKQRCITDQHFDDKINELVKTYRIIPDSYMIFRDMLPYDMRPFFGSFDIINDEFLLMVYRLLRDPSKFHYEIDGVTYQLDDNFRKFFKPEEYI